ncbi:T9SS type A sorting domain-containing protein [Crocinitomix algicola]|uniref:T9SS type A sorting domain-containing protein n=1 Tax=Crocinitomix algicola TaxID=1740263 RepID=UPI0008729E55|nr:T9SS type A sorting domain-containing protein [Crocinitomix algicola]
MNRNSFYIFLILLFCFKYTKAQYDLSATWNAYEEGTYIEDSPFNGSFTIINEGDYTIPENDTIWYGYIIDDLSYDIGLNVGYYTGMILTEPLNSGEEIVIGNVFEWPLWGSGKVIDVCAVVYGVGIESYLVDFYTGDYNSFNNKTCLTAVLPDYTTSLEEVSIESVEMINFENRIKLSSNDHESLGLVNIEVYDLQGKSIVKTELMVQNSVLWYEIPTSTKGLYIVSISVNGRTFTSKLVF